MTRGQDTAILSEWRFPPEGAPGAQAAGQGPLWAAQHSAWARRGFGFHGVTLPLLLLRPSAGQPPGRLR